MRQHPAYHLRTNKAIDRLLFVNMLRELGKDCKGYTYYSLAGPLLEDLRVMDHFFPDMRLVAIESESETAKRQRFHQFNSNIEIKVVNISRFISSHYVPGNVDVFWLDYTDLTLPHFQDFEALLTLVPRGSVIRITLRAEPEVDLRLFENRVPAEYIEKVKLELETVFDDEFQRVLPRPSAGAFASPKEFARMVQLMVQKAASNALDTTGSDVDFLHVQSTTYNDNTQMISVTGVVCLREEMENMKARLSATRFANFDWQEPVNINIPALSVKERLWLEAALPVVKETDAGEALCNVLPYRLASLKLHKKQLADYADCYRDYPIFVRIML